VTRLVEAAAARPWGQGVVGGLCTRSLAPGCRRAVYLGRAAIGTNGSYVHRRVSLVPLAKT